MRLETSKNEGYKGLLHWLWESCSIPHQIEAAHEVRYLKGRYTIERKQEESESNSYQLVPVHDLATDIALQESIAAKIAAAQKKLAEQEAV